ncbi:MAG: hypothetical protein JNL34_11770 [Anaerolineae bacterium]|nr:hypothetical protein [Anaerolineae bacterium]
MADNSITLGLEGEVAVGRFADAMTHFSGLIDSLAAELVPDARVRWIVDSLEAGSAVATVTGYADDLRPVLAVVRGAEQVGISLQQHEPIPFPTPVVREANALSRVVGNGITSLRIETEKLSAIIYDTRAKVTLPLRQTLGAVKGTVESLSSRRTLRFILYDAITDRAITCYAKDDQAELLRDIWGKRAMVSGRVTRHPETGMALSVRDITHIARIETPPLLGYRRARGVFTWQPGDEPAEVSIRRIRDAED